MLRHRNCIGGITLLILVLAASTSDAKASRLPPAPDTLRGQGDLRKSLVSIGHTVGVFERMDTRVVIAQLSLALYHLCELLPPRENPCGSYKLQGPWHNKISGGPLRVLFALDEIQQRVFSGQPLKQAAAFLPPPSVPALPQPDLEWWRCLQYMVGENTRISLFPNPAVELVQHPALGQIEHTSSAPAPFEVLPLKSLIRIDF